MTLIDTGAKFIMMGANADLVSVANQSVSAAAWGFLRGRVIDDHMSGIDGTRWPRSACDASPRASGSC